MMFTTNSPILLIDIGNTRLKWWYATPDTPLTVGTTPHALAHTGGLPLDGLTKQWEGLQPHHIRVSHVAAPELLTELHRFCTVQWADAPFTVMTPKAHHPLLSLNYDPAQMGSDRYAQLLGAQTLTTAVDHLVIGAGTALTIDGVRAGGAHIGGIIVSGMRLQRVALHHATARLPIDSGEATWTQAPNHTDNALQTGVEMACLGAIDTFSHQYLPTVKKIIVCGGDAERLITAHRQPITTSTNPIEWQHVPSLCLLGLACATAATTL